MHIEIIYEHIKEHIIGVLIGLGGLIATISMFMPKNSKAKKLIDWFKK